MESMSKAPYLLKEARFGFRMGDGKAHRRDDQRRPHQPVQRQAHGPGGTEVAAELEMTRADMDRWALRSHELAIKATDEGRLPEEIVPVTITGTQGRHGRRGRRGPAPRLEPRDAVQAAPDLPQGRLATPPATRRASTTAAARWCSPPTSGRRATARARWRRSSPRRRSPTTSPTWPAPRPRRRSKALEKAGLTRRGHRPVGDQRGVRVGDAELDPDARDRRGQGQRQRRRGRARPPDRRLGRAHPRHAGATSCAAAAAASAAPRSARAVARATR